MEFNRDFSFSITNKGNNQILVASIMRDRFHDILLEVTVGTPELIITELKVNFTQSPTPRCPLIQARLNKLVGVVIGKGLTKAIFNALDGREGCINLRNMLLASLPLVINIAAAEGSVSEGEALTKIEDRLAGTCIGYCKKNVTN
jgi:hypothetical protein